MKPYYQDDYVTIYHGDCREILPDLPKVDLVLTSPPYNLGIQYGAGTNDSRESQDYWDWTTEWLTLLHEVMNESSRMYLVVSDTIMWRIKPACEDIGWTYAQKLEWCKTNLSGGAGRIGNDWNNLSESILLFRKGKRIPMKAGGTTKTFNWFALSSPQSNFNGDKKRVHPAAFPLGLAGALVSRTPGEIILDPFLGSGTTMLSAMRQSRKCIGIEIEERYCEIAANRCRQMVMELGI